MVHEQTSGYAGLDWFHLEFVIPGNREAQGEVREGGRGGERTGMRTEDTFSQRKMFHGCLVTPVVTSDYRLEINTVLGQS